jgi:hypothetical protein
MTKRQKRRKAETEKKRRPALKGGSLGTRRNEDE